MILVKNNFAFTKGISIDTFCSTIVFVLVVLTFASCDKEKKQEDNFDRTELLRNTADGIIIPSYKNWDQSIADFSEAITSFLTETNLENLEAARSTFIESRIKWQYVAPFEFGPADELMLKARTNVHPSNTILIEQLIADGNVGLPNLDDAKGYPALDYLLFSGDDEAIINAFTTAESADSRKSFVQNLTNNLLDNSNAVYGEWINGYAEIFKENKGSSDASSISFLLNQFVFHYETYFRKAKLGIPMGIIGAQSIAPNPAKVEGLYSGTSLELFNHSLTSLKNIYLGISTTQVNGEGLDDYLRTVGREDIADDIVKQFESIALCISSWEDPIDVLIETDFTNAETCYFEIQKMINLIKAEMPSALSVAISYIEEGDGD